MDSLLLPSSIQRIRSFLVEMCGMKVKPWASTEETLAALHTTLVARHACGIFWDSMRTLLESLARDMRTRASATPGTLIDNEVLEAERYARLLDEIRQALARQGSEASAGSFRRLSAALSAPALGLLLFLGGVASVGCDRSGLSNGQGKPDAALAADVSGPNKGSPPPATDAEPQIVWKLDAPPATRPDAPAEGPPRIVLPPNPDTVPGATATTRGADGGVVTISDIMSSCNVPETLQRQVLGCLSLLDESWTTVMPQTLAGGSCDAVQSDLNCFATFSTTCQYSREPRTFVVGKTRICNPIPIYAGVRFV